MRRIKKYIAILMVLIMIITLFPDCSVIFGLGNEQTTKDLCLSGTGVEYMPPNPEAYPEFYKQKKNKEGTMYAQSNNTSLSPPRDLVAPIQRVAPPTNTEKILVIPLAFTDVNFETENNKDHFNAIMDELKDYYEQNSSYSRNFCGITTETTVVDVVYSAYTMAEYGDDGSDIDDFNGDISEMAREAVRLLDDRGDITVSDFDTNSDGVIDHLIIIHAGMGQEEEAGNTNRIWSHRSEITGGEAIGTKRVENYVTVPETGTLGVFAHEFGHDLGLPDLYDTDGWLNGYTEGVGDWDLMGSGSWNHLDGEAPGTARPTYQRGARSS